MRDENGQVSHYSYNDNNDLTSVTNALGERTDFSYEPNFNQVAAVTDALGRRRAFSYDSRGNLTGISHPDGSSRAIAYNELGLPESVTDENGNTTGLQYNDYGQLARIAFPDGSSRGLTADIVGRITSVTDELGNTTSLDYNKLGSLVKSVDPLGAATTFVYDELQRKVKAINALGAATSYEYSRRSTVSRETDPSGNSVSYEYDGEENLVKKTFPNQTGIDFGYDERNRLVRERTFPGGLETVSVYDAKGQKVAEQDANGNRTTFSYDPVGRAIGKTDATGATTSAEYDAVGNLIRILDPNGNPIDYGYDNLNRLLSQANGLGNTTSYRYDAVGNLIGKQKPDGGRIGYSYDSRNRLTSVSYPDGSEKSYAYDRAGRMVRMANESTEEKREYDARGRMLTATDKYTGRIDYRYDLLGNRISMVDPDGGESSYSYDAENHLTAFTDPEGKVTTYTYDVMGRELTTSLPNHTETVNTYNDDNRLAAMITTSDRDGVLASFAYTYDAVGNKLSMTEEDGGVTGYQYDAAYRLIQVNYPKRVSQATATAKNNGTDNGRGKKNGHQKSEENLLPITVSYVYDPAGNRVSKTDDYQTVNYQYNAANQLLRAGNASYSYDANGNRTSKQDDEGASYYQYNSDDFLVQFDDPKGQATVYGYDAADRRVYKAQGEKNKEITSYLYDGLEVLQEVSGQNSQKITEYYRANGRIITQQKYDVSQANNGDYQHRPEGRQLFYAYDGLGSVTALSNHQGMRRTRYRYDAFGEVIEGDLTENQYTFTGKQLDPESGLYHFHFRQYDAEVGVWATADPIGILGGVNLYGYVRNNPVKLVDLLGLVMSAGELGVGNPGSHGGENRSESMHGTNGLGAGNDWGDSDDLGVNIDDLFFDFQRDDLLLALGSVLNAINSDCILSDKLKECMLEKFSDLSIEYEDDIEDCGHAWTVFSDTIHLGPNAFDSSRCGPLESTIFHEMVHSCGNVAETVPQACEAACYGYATNNKTNSTDCK